MARVMVLCAGFGSRLQPLTDELPKPLLPIGDRPLLAHIAENLKTLGYTELVINTHHLPGDFIRVVERLPIRVTVSYEPEILGTAGGIRQARSSLEPSVLIWNGDTLLEPDIAALERDANGAGLCLLIRPRPRGEGAVGLAAEGRVSRLRGESFETEVAGADYVGVALMGADVLDTLPGTGCIIADVCLPRLRSRLPIRSSVYEGKCFESGTLSAYFEANMRWLEQHGSAEWVGSGVALGGRVTRSIVGEGARIEASVVDSVIWPGAHVSEPVERSIVTTAGQIIRVP